MIILLLVLMTSIVVPASLTYAKTKKSQVGTTATTEQLEQKYQDAAASGKKVRILIVPGHEPQYGGTEYKGVYEREINVEIANQLATYLAQNPRLDVVVARGNDAWNSDLTNYFENDWDSIQNFVENQKAYFEKQLDKGNITARNSDDQVAHAAAPDDVALRLYGVGKWANDNDVDLVLHLHINDAPDHGPNDPSLNSGFAVYVPDSQYGNAATSLPVGEAIAARLSSMNATSTLPVENKGVVEDQELIALGAYNTLSVPSVLMEYSYITEPKFQQPEVRQTVTKDYAYETYLGVQDFFKDAPVVKYPTASLPFTFASSSLAHMGSSSPATYALQAGLHTLGYYPTYASTTPANVRLAAPTLTNCPIDGVMGPCTTNAIESFQISKGWQTTGTLGPKTVAALNMLFSSQPVQAVVAPGTPPQASASTVSGTCVLPTHSMTLNDTDVKTHGDVSLLQKILSRDTTIYPQKLVTGTFGPATLAAVQKFQVKQGIAKKGDVGYGLVGPKTLAALKALCI